MVTCGWRVEAGSWQLRHPLGKRCRWGKLGVTTMSCGGHVACQVHLSSSQICMSMLALAMVGALAIVGALTPTRQQCLTALLAITCRLQRLGTAVTALHHLGSEWHIAATHHLVKQSLPCRPSRARWLLR